MKILKQLFTLAAIALLMTACNKNDEFAPETDSTFPADGIIRVATSVANPQTRAGMTTANLETFQMRIVNENNSAYSYHADMIKEDGEWKSINPADYPLLTPLTMLWQNKTQKVRAAAVFYSGASIEQTDWDEPFPLSVGGDQTTDIMLEISDILYMEEKVIDPSKDLDDNGKMQIALNHRLSKLNLTVKMGTEFNKLVDGTINNPITEMKVDGTYNTVYWKLAENTLVDYRYQNAITLWNNSLAYTAGEGDTNQAEAKYECILIPQTVAADVFEVSFKIGDRDFSWVSPTEVVLAANTQYNLTLNVGKNVVTVAGFTATPWSEADEQSIGTE